MNRFSIYLLLIIIVSCPFSAQADIYKKIEMLKQEGSFDVDISSLTGFYNTLPIDEKGEQIRDWAMFGLLSRLNISQDKACKLLHQKFPLRLPYLKNMSSFEIAPGRIENVSDNDWVVILPVERVNDKGLLACLIDTKRVNVPRIPKWVHLFSYTIGTITQTITIAHTTSIAGQRLFSSEYLYTEKRVTNLGDFSRWLSAVNDITYFSWREGSLTVGGRRYETPLNRALTLEDVAAIYQAYHPPLDPSKEAAKKQQYEHLIQEKYKEVLKNNPNLKKQIQSGRVSSEQIVKEIRRRIPYSSMDVEINIGFSLDPQKDYTTFADEINLLAGYDTNLGLPDVPQLKGVINDYQSRLRGIAADLKKGMPESYLVLRRELIAANNPVLKWFDETLFDLEQKNSYQSARYDGNLKGTTPGMILFYTDLNAKLWAIDYEGVAPRDKVSGFRTMPEIKVSKLYWEEFLKLSGTRLWFGLNPENYDIYGHNLYLAPTVTRIYAASSNALYPGKESEPNVQSAEFLSWWDRHYQAMADYEPQYYKLDQVQKWACIFLLLKEKKLKGLDFLKNVSVRHNLNFEKWYDEQTDLKSKIKLPFADRKRYGQNTECLLLLRSQPYPMMGLSFFLSGGVSLASKKDILAKLKKSEVSPLPKSKPLPQQKSVKEQRTVRYEFPQQPPKPNQPRVWNVIPKPETKMRSQEMELSTANQRVELNARKQGLNLKYNLNNVPYGNFSTKNEPKKVVLNWEEKEGYLLNELLSEIVAKEENERLGIQQILTSIPRIEKIVDKDAGQVYLLKLVAVDTWIQLTINPQILSNEKNQYVARASGSQPDSNIYEARILP